MTHFFKWVRRAKSGLLAPPRCLFSFRYFADESTPVVFHRRLFIESFNCPSHLLAQIIRIFYWWGFAAFFNSFKASKSLKQESLEKYHFTRVQLFAKLLKHAYLNFIPPALYFKLINQQHASVLQKFLMVYDQQTQFIHKAINRSYPNYKQAVRLIGDKYLFSQQLIKLNIPTPHSKLIPTATIKRDPNCLFKEASVFCKPNKGNKAQNAFHLEYRDTSSTYVLYPFHDAPVEDQQAILKYIKNLPISADNLLVQTYLRDHEDIPNSQRETISTTFRVITTKKDPRAEAHLIYIQIELPGKKTEFDQGISRQFFEVAPLDLNHYRPDRAFLSKHSNTHPVCADFTPSESLKKYIQQAVDYCKLAHSKLIDLRSVAFDLIISQNGPYILEANHGWALSALYSVVEGSPLNPSASHPASLWLKEIYEEAQ